MHRWIMRVGIGFGLASSNLASAAPGKTAAATPPRIKVAIIPSIAVGLDAAKVDALGQDLAEALAAELDIDSVGGLEVRRQLPPDGLPADCVANRTCTEDVAKRVGAGQLLFVAMVDTAGRGAVQIDSTWVEPKTGKSAARSVIIVPSVNEARPRFAAAARQLLPDAPVRRKDMGIEGAMTPAMPRHITRPAIVTAGVGAVGLGVGLYFGITSRQEFNDCNRDPNCSQDDRDRITRDSLIADIGFVVAIGGAVASTVIYMTSSKEPRLLVAPTNADGGASVFAVGRF